MKKVLSIIVTVFLVVALATTGVFADSVDFIEVPHLSTYTSSDILSDGVNVGYTNAGRTQSLWCGYGFSSNSPQQTIPLYAFAFFDSGYIRYGVAYSGDDLLGTNKPTLYSCLNSGGNVTSSTNIGTLDSSTGLYFYNFYGTGLSNTNIAVSTVFSSKSDALTALSSYIASQSTIGEVFNFSLSPGYALVINGPCEISDRTYSITGSWNFDRLTNSRINGSFERVVQTNNLIDGFSPDRYLTIEQLLPWWADNSNALGVASNYSYHNTDVVTLSDGGINYVLGYPLYYQGSGDYSFSHENAVSLTGSIYFQYSGTRPTISKIAIESLAEIVEGHYHYYNVFRPDVYDESGEVVSDGQGGVVVTFPDAPAGGGNSGQPPVNEETNLFGVLSKFVNDIKNLISQGSHAISELVNYGSSFMHSIAQMYDWLPATLTTLIVTAFSIVLVIGVIKLLWK